MLDKEKFEKRAKDDFPANKKFIQHLKRRSPSDLDNRIHALHEEAFLKTDCLECANCCKTTSPIFKESDIDRLSRHLKIKPSVFIEKWLHRDEDNDYVLNSSPCPFLDDANYCSVYESRPAACREYPHTNRKRMYQLLDLTLRNTKVCPAVLNIVQKLREASGG